MSYIGFMNALSDKSAMEVEWERSVIKVQMAQFLV